MTEQAELIPQNPFVFTDRVIELVSLEDFVEPPVTASFQKSVEDYGVMEPIIVYPSGRKDGMYRIADGRRRTLASFRAGRTTIPAMVVTGGDESAIDLHKITIIANAQRGNNPFSEYQAIMALVKSGKSEKQIAVETGMPVGTIRKRMKLNALPTVVIDKVREGVISAGAAETATKLSKSQMDELVELLNDPDVERVTHTQVLELRDVDRDQAVAELPDQLFMPEVARTMEEYFKDEVRALTNRYAMIPSSEMIRILEETVAIIKDEN